MAVFLPVDATLESVVRAHGERLLALMDELPPPRLFSKQGAYAKLMELSMRDPVFKTQLFRFVDVLPSLTSSAEIVRHLQEYLGDAAVTLAPALRAGLAASSWAPGLVAGPVKAQIEDLAGQFVAGRTGRELLPRVRHNRKRGLATTVDLLGEAVLTEAEADTFLARNLEVLDALAALGKAEPEHCASDQGPAGPLPWINLSVKISAFAPPLNPCDPEGSIRALQVRLRPLLRRARELGALVNFDMESHRTKDLTLALLRATLAEEEFRSGPSLGIALQAYLRDCETDLRALLAWAREHQRPLHVRLVKGAYWDYETVLAQQREWPVPVWSRKPESDANFEKLTVLLLENADLVTADFATHNVRSVAHAIAQAERLGVHPRAFEFQALFGMADELKLALVRQGFRVREYCPVGEMLPGMAYLVRRLLENTSNEGFLRQKHRGEATTAALLANPTALIAGAPAPLARPARPAGAFANVALLDFSRAEARDGLAGALAALRGAAAAAQGRLGRRWPLVIDGRPVSDREYVASTNPARPGEVVGHWAVATKADADAAVAGARAAFPAWSRRPVEERAAVLEKLAERLEAQRFAWCAREILEAGKPWAEADGDVAEAIDFCRYYAVQMRRLDRGEITQDVPGERCRQLWTPRGVVVAIAPWNFPLAILTGLVVAPLVAGNTVIMKPAEQTSVLAAWLMEELVACGVPPGVVQFLPGRGEEVGAHLVEHPGVNVVAFTGSRAVGLQIWERAARTPPGQRHLKHVVCEMGGKNPLIIDGDADLDEAIPAALHSAFGFSGQKCSALSRLIVLAEVYDVFLERLVAACAAWPVGDPSHPATLIGPVIDAEAQQRLLGQLERGRRDATVVWQGTVPAEGCYVPPTVFVDVPPEHPLLREELFGPVLVIQRAKDLDHAFALANDSEYALTAGLFSRRPSALARAERELRAGNLYLNRSITGAVVERHPFGGYALSGGGTKAGGAHYLQNFLHARVVAENTLRRGFTPAEVGE